MDYVIRLAKEADAPAYTKAYLNFAGLAYENVMPAGFREEQLRAYPDWYPGFLASIQEMWRALLIDAEPKRKHWMAFDEQGVAAIAASGPGVAEWEVELGYPAPPIDFALDKLYLHPRVQGSGLAEELLALALPEQKGAYLWMLGGNPRAERFYHRHGFRPDGLESDCGPHWHHHPMYRLWRPDPTNDR